MSVNIDMRVVGVGNDEYVESAWKLKERIRQEEGVLKQRRSFFTDAYRRARVHLFLVDDDPIAFAATRRDGYILFLAVDPEYRDHGLGERLVAEVADEHETVTCHARETNRNALGFYDHLGFEVVRKIDSYYEDGGNAYYLRLGEDASLTERLSEFLRRP